MEQEPGLGALNVAHPVFRTCVSQPQRTYNTSEPV
jgi:hypothetical protein